MVKGWLKSYFTLVLLIILAGLAGWFGRVNYANSLPSRLLEIRENPTGYHYINPLLIVDSPREAPEYNYLQSAMVNYINQVKQKGLAEDVSVYFRDLNPGKWTGVNQDELYDPSSMLKVAVMVGYLKLANDQPNLLSETLSYKAKVDAGQHYKPIYPLATGLYSVSDLIKTMAIDSDNVAMVTLLNNNRQSIINVFRSLDIPPPTIDSLDFMSPKTYSVIFRTLYSSTYLPRDVSEQALELLAHTNFKVGLVAGVPAGVVVAHKFGEHTDIIANQAPVHQLHDCGIIYVPKKPYFLCVMTRGSNFPNLEKVISGLSDLVYKKIVVNK